MRHLLPSEQNCTRIEPLLRAESSYLQHQFANTRWLTPPQVLGFKLGDRRPLGPTLVGHSLLAIVHRDDRQARTQAVQRSSSEQGTTSAARNTARCRASSAQGQGGTLTGVVLKNTVWVTMEYKVDG